MQKPNDLNQSRIVLKQDSTLIAVIEMDAQPDQRCFHSVDNPSLLSDEALALAVGRRSLALRPAHSRCHQFVTR